MAHAVPPGRGASRAGQGKGSRRSTQGCFKGLSSKGCPGDRVAFVALAPPSFPAAPECPTRLDHHRPPKSRLNFRNSNKFARTCYRSVTACTACASSGWCRVSVKHHRRSAFPTSHTEYGHPGRLRRPLRKASPASYRSLDPIGWRRLAGIGKRSGTYEQIG